MEPTNGSAGLLATAASALRVDTSGVFLDVFGDRSEFSTFEEFSDLFVRFEKKSRYIFRVKNSSSVEAENRRRKDKIDSAIKYSGLVLCCVNCGDANKTLKKVQEGDSRQLCDAHIYLRYRSSSRKLAIISSSFVHNHASQAGNGCFHRKQSVTERIGKPRDGRRKFVKAGDKMGKLTRPILPLPLFEHRLLKNTSELTIIPLGAGLLPLTGDLPTPPPPRLLLNSGPEDRRGQCPAGPMKPDKRPTLPSLQPPPSLRGPDAGPTSRGDPLSGVKAEPLAGGGARDARRGKEEPGLVRTCLGETGICTNSRVAGKDTTDCGCSRCMFYGAINAQKLATNLLATGTNEARADQGQKTGELATNSHVPGTQIARTDCKQKCGNPLRNRLSHAYWYRRWCG
ncbi:unnamed protein product [Ixodes pacificus]